MSKIDTSHTALRALASEWMRFLTLHETLHAVADEKEALAARLTYAIAQDGSNSAQLEALYAKQVESEKEAQAMPSMADAIAAGDGTLHGAIEYWQDRALKAESMSTETDIYGMSAEERAAFEASPGLHGRSFASLRGRYLDESTDAAAEVWAACAELYRERLRVTELGRDTVMDAAGLMRSRIEELEAVQRGQAASQA